jgi:uncharacterized membrane-anchored protein
MKYNGIARYDRRTKDLVKRILPGEIAIINHVDLDEVAAESLVAAKAKVVINVTESISGRYPNLGPSTLSRAGVQIIDNVGLEFLDKIYEGIQIEIIDNSIYHNDNLLAQGQVLDAQTIKEKIDETKANLRDVLEKFVQNTIEYAQNEQGLILGDVKIPYVKTHFKGRHTLIVVRGQNYKEDLQAIHSYIQDMRPILIGVDGGADAIREFGYKPDLIIGDMDSITDETLRCGAELIVHAYPDGRAPGLERVLNLGLEAATFPAPGTSEDIAMLLAFEKGTDLIVAVGTHSNMIDFLEKGRKGMASTFLVRMKIGSILVDAKGVSKLYRQHIKLKYVAGIVLAACLPLFIVFFSSPMTNLYLNALLVKFKLLFGI